MAEAKKADKVAESKGDADPWDGFTPDSLTDAVADKIWAKMGAADDDGGDDKGGTPAEPEPVIEKPPAPIHKGARFLKFWLGE